MHRRADPQVIQEQPKRRVQGRVPDVLAVLIQPRLDKGQQRAGEGRRNAVTFLNDTLSQGDTAET